MWPERQKLHGALSRVLDDTTRPLVLGYAVEQSEPFVVSGKEDSAKYHIPPALPKDRALMKKDDKTGLGVYGRLPDLERNLAKRIAEHYGVGNITIQQRVYNTSDQVFDALSNGEIDGIYLFIYLFI